jgi:hypothetical protein
VLGTIRQVDAAKGAIQVQSSGQQGEARWIVLSPQTTMMRHAQGTLAELKVGESIQVSGVPTAISASQLQVGEMPQMEFRGGFGGGGNRGGAPGGAPEGAPGQGRRGPAEGQGARLQPPSPQFTGTIASTNPLVVVLPGNMRLNVTAAPTTKVVRIVKATLTDLKVGDNIRAVGQPDENGNVIAMRVEVGVDLQAGAGFGPGGFGGGFGDGAFRRGGGAGPGNERERL